MLFGKCDENMGYGFVQLSMSWCGRLYDWHVFRSAKVSVLRGECEMIISAVCVVVGVCCDKNYHFEEKKTATYIFNAFLYFGLSSKTWIKN